MGFCSFPDILYQTCIIFLCRHGVDYMLGPFALMLHLGASKGKPFNLE